MAARPTILQIIPNLDTGGAEQSTLEMAEAIARAGGRALVASEGGRLVPKLRDLGGEIIFFPASTKNPLAMAWNARALARLVIEENVSLVHARSRAPAWSALWAARRTKRPFVTTYHGAYGEKGRLKNCYNSVMARGDVVIANSNYTARLIESRYATAKSRLRVIYRGAASPAFDPANVAPDRVTALRRRWNVPEGDRIILQAARLSGWKGHLVVLDALARLGEISSVTMVFAGDAQGRDGLVAEIEQRIRALGLDGKVRLVGHCDDMPAAYAASHVTVVASTEPEAFGRAAAEAQAMGCPVISTNIGAPPETVLAEPTVPQSAATGWLIEPGDPDVLAKALRGALEMTPDERAAMGVRARAHVTSKFTVTAMQRQTLAVYDELLSMSLAAQFDAAGARTP